MFKNFFKNLLVILILVIFSSSKSYTQNFDGKILEIRSEINRDNLNVAINLLSEININNELQQDKINILFGDIYLKINKPQKAEEFYQKAFFTSNKDVEALCLICRDCSCYF